MRKLFSFLLLLLLKIYQYTLSPVFAFFGVKCRHEPSCSNYGIEAIRTHGSWCGGWLTLSRLLRCHPFGSSGYDPVPKKGQIRGKFWQIHKLGDWSWTLRGVEHDHHNCNPHAHMHKETEQSHD